MAYVGNSDCPNSVGQMSGSAHGSQNLGGYDTTALHVVSCSRNAA